MSSNTYPNEVIRALFERHTIRKYFDKPIDANVLKTIVEAGLRAPSAGGAQSPTLLVCQDKQANERLGRISHDLYDEGYYPVSTAQPSTADDPANTDGFYGAPCIIHCFTPKGYDYADYDAAMSACYMMLAAWSLGIGSCFVSRAKRLFATEEGRAFARKHGIPNDYEGAFHLCLGHPSDTSWSSKPQYPDRVHWS